MLREPFSSRFLWSSRKLLVTKYIFPRYLNLMVFGEISDMWGRLTTSFHAHYISVLPMINALSQTIIDKERKQKLHDPCNIPPLVERHLKVPCRSIHA